MTTLESLNSNSIDTVRSQLLLCCGSGAWVSAMLQARPFASEDEIIKQAATLWFELGPKDWLEAFSHHPRIGASLDELKKKYASTSAWAQGEQSGVQGSDLETLKALQQGNLDYEKKFGHIFLICATGKSAKEMLLALQARLKNPPDIEIKIAAAEQNKITQLRLQKLLHTEDPSRS